MLEDLYEIHSNVTKNTPQKIKRFLFNKINWESNAICITGARGVGKTTLLLQYYLEKYDNPDECLYISADNLHVISQGLLNTVAEYFKYGGKAIIIDEIHKYPDWSMHLKNIIDTYKDKQILISGSSSLDLRKGKYDLSRRIVYYELPILSLREYIHFQHDIFIKPVAIEKLLKDHTRIARDVSGKMTILKDFNEYLKSGNYPYFLEGRDEYNNKLYNVIEKVLFEDVSVVFNMKQKNINIIKKILWLIASSQPFMVNIAKMSNEFNVSKEYIYNYLEYLEMAGLITSLRKKASGYKMIRKPDKIYLENPNLIYVINGNTGTVSQKGTLREAFFVNQVKSVGTVNLSDYGDFLVDNKHFEIGGKNKSFKQIQDIKDSYLVMDEIEIGAGNKIPLYLFGFLY